jgi:basic amino acid/polyamine antiporter, APA family
MKSNKLGIWSSTSYVVGNMIGSGVFMLPVALAAYGGVSILGWGIAALGALLLASIFKYLTKQIPNVNGGPYAFAKVGLGEFPAFLVAWGYWISIWCTNGAIAVAFVSYLTVFIPSLSVDFISSMMIGLSVIWFLTWFNTLQVTYSGRLQLVSTILKLLPLVLISVFGLFFIRMHHFFPINLKGDSLFSVLTATVTLCLFAFLGLESATIPEDKIADSKRTIPRATFIGTGIAIVVYILSSISVMGIIPPEELKLSNAPFADAAAIMWGQDARYLVAVGALISTFGALNGWILLQGQIPAAAAKDGIFPALFKRENKNGMPTFGLIVSSVLASLLMYLNYSKGFGDTFKFILLLATLTALLPYLFSVTTYLLMVVSDQHWKKKAIKRFIIGFVALLFIIWTIAGCGQEVVFWGFLLLLAGIPFYIWLKQYEHRENKI